MSKTSRLILNGTPLFADLSGALIWPEQDTVVVSDLHFEKAISLAAGGQPLPPYDTQATLGRLESVVAQSQPARVICLGDSFHRPWSAEGLHPRDRTRIRNLATQLDWIWISGNHDPTPPADLGGRSVETLSIGPLVFRHQAIAGAAAEISGHYHPKASVKVRGGRITGRCFAFDQRRLILPAFGALTGGLNVLDPAIAPFLGPSFEAIVIGRSRLVRVPRSCLALPVSARRPHWGNAAD